jgi:branched-chain amino acid transport system permease protein
MDLANFLIQLLNSVQYGLLLFMLAAGLTLIFGIMGVVNLAHGSFYMLGAYLAYALSAQLGSFSAAIVVGTLLSVVFGLVLERVLFRHFYQRDHLDQVLLTFGLIYIFEESRSLLWGDDVHGVPVPPLLTGSLPLTDTLSYPLYRLFMMALCVLLAVGLYLLIGKTRLGMKIRAGAFNRDMAESLGINIKLIHAVVFAIGVALAAGGHDRRAHLQRLPQHGLVGADHVLRRRGDRRHRLGARRAGGRAAGRPGGHLRQGAAAAGLQHAGVHADGGGAAVEARGFVQVMTTPATHLEALPRAMKALLALGLAALALFPFVGSDFYQQMVVRMMILAIFAMSLDLLQGVTGLVSLGHAAYFGIAGYALAFSRRRASPSACGGRCRPPCWWPAPRRW